MVWLLKNGGVGGMAVKTIPEKPNRPCSNCKSNKWWLRDKGWGKPEWLCCRCHPEPKVRVNNENV